MSESALFRLSSIGVVVGAVLIGLASLVPSDEDVKAAVAGGVYYPMSIAMLVGGVLLIAGWPAVYLRQRARSGVLGLVGMLLVFGAGATLTIGFTFTQVMIFPWLASLPVTNAQLSQGPPAINVFFPVATLVVTVGGVLFAVATLRARVFPRWVPIAFIVLAVASFAANFAGPLEVVGEALFMVGFVLYGIALWLSVAARAVTSPDTTPAARRAVTP